MSKRVNTSRIKQLRSYERYVPRQPPQGAMRHLNAKEISRCRELIPRSVLFFFLLCFDGLILNEM